MSIVRRLGREIDRLRAENAALKNDLTPANKRELLELRVDYYNLKRKLERARSALETVRSAYLRLSTKYNKKVLEGADEPLGDGIDRGGDRSSRELLCERVASG